MTNGRKKNLIIICLVIAFCNIGIGLINIERPERIVSFRTLIAKYILQVMDIYTYNTFTGTPCLFYFSITPLTLCCFFSN